ncbi:MAG TPA: hypothetical protein VFT76_00180 [Actinomycetota bacterium]|nr:hypothetical protein [Actinomycetota bacterium]
MTLVRWATMWHVPRTGRFSGFTWCGRKIPAGFEGRSANRVQPYEICAVCRSQDDRGVE